jgi:hypothetical protein
MPSSASTPKQVRTDVDAPATFRRLDSARVLAIGGLLLVAGGMVVGEIYAIYISHVANAIISQNWGGVVESAGRGDLGQLREHFAVIGDLTEKRARTMSAHSHLAAYGLLALVLALVHPSVELPSTMRLRIAVVFLTGCLLQAGGLYVSYYAGEPLLYLADAGGLLLILAVGATCWGLRKRSSAMLTSREFLREALASRASRWLVKSGLLLTVLGMMFGLIYAWQLVSVHEPTVYDSIGRAAASLAGNDTSAAAAEIAQFKRMQSKIAITAAAHSHAIEFGFLMLLLAFVQRYVMLSERWQLRWARTVSVGAFALPVCVYLATLYGLRAAAFSDLFGAVALLGLSAMAYGIVRHTGAVDASTGSGAAQ